MKYFNNEHKKAYHLAIEKSGINDVYHQSLFYTLTIDKDCREILMIFMILIETVLNCQD